MDVWRVKERIKREIKRFDCWLLQDPVIFSGSVRSNLDPFGEAANDKAIWNSLKQAGLEAVVRSMPVHTFTHLSILLKKCLVRFHEGLQANLLEQD